MNVNNNLRPSNSNSSERTADERRQIWYLLCARMVPSIRVKNCATVSNAVQRCKNGTVKGNPAY